MRKIITIPNPTLRAVTKEINKVDKKLINFIKDLETTLLNTSNHQGVGLASPQVDKSLRAFTIHLNKQTTTFINPIITKKSSSLSLGKDEADPDLEGCFSIPELYAPVPRHTWIEVEYQVLKNNKLVSTKDRLNNFHARVFQHELDHLDGILFTDYALQYDLPVYRQIKNKYEEVDHSLLELF